MNCGDKTLPLPHNLYDYCSIRIFSLVEKYLVVKRKISFADKVNILSAKLLYEGGISMYDKSGLEAELNQRGIKSLVHFTSANNIPSIIQYGILSRNELDNQGISYQYNDIMRLDGHLDAISLSVTFPNYKMFYRSRKVSDTNWVVLIIDPNIILYADCLFYHTNAANRNMHLIDQNERKTLEAFKYMFYDRDIRKIVNMDDNETTDPQAEIQVVGRIPVNMIKLAVFENEVVLNQYMEYLSQAHIKSIVDKEYYCPRRDYKYWGENNS